MSFFRVNVLDSDHLCIFLYQRVPPPPQFTVIVDSIFTSLGTLWAVNQEVLSHVVCPVCVCVYVLVNLIVLGEWLLASVCKI